MESRTTTGGGSLQRSCSPWSGSYRPSTAQEQANGKRSRSRRNQRFEGLDWDLVESLLRENWSPEQASGSLRETGDLSISHETIDRYVWEDRARIETETGCQEASGVYRLVCAQ